MADFDYSFDNRGMYPKKEGYARGIIIFIVILLITVGIIYLIVPKEAFDGGDKNDKGKSPTENVETSAANSVVDPAAENQIQPPVETPASEAIKEETPQLEPEKGGTDEPVKGKPWKNDPAPEADLPEKPTPEATLRSEKFLTEKNWQSIASKSAEWCLSHTVVRGDTLERIARKYHTTVNALKEFNKLKSNTVYLGSKLSVVPGPWRIEVSKSSRRLRLFNTAQAEPRTFGVYDVGIGREGRTPTADFVISIRLRNPDYIAPDGGVYAYNTSGNPLGDYFLKLAQPEKADRPLAGYGIHGTPDDSDVGRSISHGCIRMRNLDVKELYLLCPVGTPVHVVE